MSQQTNKLENYRLLDETISAKTKFLREKQFNQKPDHHRSRVEN